MSARPNSYLFWFFAAVAVHAGLIFAWSKAIDLRAEYGVALGESIEITLIEPVAEPAAQQVIEAALPPEPVRPPPEPVPEPIPEFPPPAEPEMIEPQPHFPPSLPKPPSATRPSRTITPTQPATLPRGIADAPAGSRSPSGVRTNAKPNYLSNPPPPYPAASKEAHEEGVVLLTVAVNEQGRAASVRLHRSSGFPRLDGAALRAVRSWRFSPARIGGIPVSSEVQVPVRFELK